MCLLAKFHEKIKVCLTVKFCKKNQKCLNLGPKMPFFIFWYFWARIWKNYYDIWNQHFRICPNAKFREKMKMPNFGTENALFRYIWARILKNYCHIWVKKWKYLNVLYGYFSTFRFFDLKSASMNLSSCKAWCKTKNL